MLQSEKWITVFKYIHMHAFDETTFYNDKSWKSSLTENEKFHTPETGGKLIRRYYKAFPRKGTYKSRYSMKMIVEACRRHGWAKWWMPVGKLQPREEA